MEPGRHFDQILEWSERLRLLAHVQSEYRAQLVEQGFDEEEAGTLVRDWSHRVWDWTTRANELDPRLGSGGEPYLLTPQTDAAPQRIEGQGTWWFGDHEADEAA